jgi:hypothetical protein
MSARKGTSVALSARLDTRGTKVALESRVMRRRKTLMIWTMNSTISNTMGKVQSGSWVKEKMVISLPLLTLNHTIGFPA